MDNSLLEQIRKIIHWKKSNKYMAERLGVTEKEIEDAKKSLRDQGKDEDEEPADIQDGYESSYHHDIDKQTIKVAMYYDTPPTPEDVIRDHKIDTSKWKLSQYWSKQKGKGWQVSALFAPISTKEQEGDLVTKLFARYQTSFQGIRKEDIIINDSFARPTCALISLADFHLDKKTLEQDNIHQRAALYDLVLSNLLSRVYKTHYVDEIVFLIGNDFLHTDSYHNTTTNLTPQDTTESWYDAYEHGFDLMARSIAKIKQFCNKLTVVHIPSNHSRTKEYYMAHALQVLFQNDPNIVFNRGPENTKVYLYGNNFIGMHHGDTASDKLPLYFASKFGLEWGITKHREIALADKHHRKQWDFSLTSQELQGIRMFIAPSLSREDKWHKDKLFDTAIKAAILRVYDKETGYCTEFEERI